MSATTRGVIAHAIANDGVITRREALALGMPERTLDRRIEEGVLIRIAPGAYALPGVFEAEASTLAAATRGLGAVVSHQAAARLHGVPVAGPRLVVSVPHRRTHLFPDVVVHQLTDIREHDLTMVGSLPTTAPSRTAIDLAAVLSLTQLGRAVDRFAARGLASFEQMSQVLDELGRKGKPGVVRLRRALEPRLGSSGSPESDLESRLLEVIRLSGLPEPNVQHRPPWLKHVNGRVDLAYPDSKVVIEGDSREWHGDEYTFQADRERDNLAQLAGWRILRFTWKDITRRPEYVVDSIRRILEASLSA
ncbi:MAG TPA: type IV toxin-antitoxin system AbiEi family antitoxin domain-containing protein [Acidimicrobiia bacterium]|jgi:very-short-patch-repair endonuclease